MACTATSQCVAVDQRQNHRDASLTLDGGGVAQTFTVGTSGMLTEIRFDGFCLKQYYLAGVSSGAPSTMQLTSFKPYLGEWRDVKLDDGMTTMFAYVAEPPLQVRRGEQFAIVGEEKTSGGTCLGAAHATSNVYAGGAMYIRSIGTEPWTAQPGDLAFQVIVRP